MALQGPIPVEFGQAFPDGVYAAGGFEPVRDFDASANGRFVQSKDKSTGLPLWVVEVIDADATALTRTVKVKVAAQEAQRKAGRNLTPNELTADVKGITIHAARKAVARYRAGRIPVATTPGLAPKSVKNVHRMIHLALATAVAWRYIDYNPAEHAALPREAGRNP
jgi:hypothetical protein